ncbi:MAG: hypothetical protein GY946_14430, partial [bacterium]|nr:hypothetical protein [bacterium]
GEKLHEVLLTEDEARNSREFDTHFVIGGDSQGGRQVPEGLIYSSDQNSLWLTVDRLSELIQTWKADRG